MSEVVTFRVNRRLKARMEMLRHINWSELLRSYVERVVEDEERRLRPRRDHARMMRAVEEMERLARLAEGTGWLGSEEVIRWRRKRYSYLTPA